MTENGTLVAASKGRWFVGAAGGTILSGLSLILTRGGHGTYAPMAWNASFLFFLPLLALVVTPVLWAAYYELVPKIFRQGTRRATLAAITLLHTGPALWLALTEPSFRRSVELDSDLLLVFGVAATGILLGLVWLGWPCRGAGLVAQLPRRRVGG